MHPLPLQKFETFFLLIPSSIEWMLISLVLPIDATATATRVTP